MAFWDGYRWIRPSREGPSDKPDRVRNLLATIPMIALIPALLVVALLVQAAGPYLTGPGSVAPGASVPIAGHLFPPNARVQLTWDGSSTSMPTARADKSGSFSTLLTVPISTPVGTHTIRASSLKGSRTSRATAMASLQVTVAIPGSGATPTPVPTAKPTATPTADPTATPRPTPTPTPRPTPTPVATPTPPSTSPIRHVIIVWLENHEYGSVTASSMPYYYGLLHTYGQATSYYAVTHPSLPNYLAVWSGSTQGVTDDNIHNLSAVSLSNQLTAAGLSWRAYMQDYPGTGCFTGSSNTGGTDGPGVSGTYVRKHNPPMSFTYVSGSATQCGNVQPLARFDPSVNVAFVSPNLCNDAHDCSLTTADNFLKGFLPSVFNAPDWAHTALFVSFDEGSTNTNGGGHVTMLVARPGLSGFTSATVHNHYGMLRTVEDTFGLGCLANSCTAAPLSEFMP
jgi:hypothetical protein